MKKLLIALFSVFAMASANAATYSIGWAGAASYSLTGLLTFNSALVGTGVIDESQITDLSFEVFNGATSQGSWGLLSDGFANTDLANDFNLNFNTITEQFVVGGFSGGTAGQVWNTETSGNNCVGVGFASGSSASTACVSGGYQGLDTSSITITATRIDTPAVPVPAALFLFAPALLGFLGLRRKVTTTA